MSLLGGGGVAQRLTAAERENSGSVLIGRTMAEAHAASSEQTSAEAPGGNAADDRGQALVPPPLAPATPQPRRSGDDPVPVCRRCGGLLRRVPVAGSVVKTWRCDLHGEGVIPEWAPPLRDEQDGHFPYPTEES